MSHRSGPRFQQGHPEDFCRISGIPGTSMSKPLSSPSCVSRKDGRVFRSPEAVPSVFSALPLLSSVLPGSQAAGRFRQQRFWAKNSDRQPLGGLIGWWSGPAPLKTRFWGHGYVCSIWRSELALARNAVLRWGVLGTWRSEFLGQKQGWPCAPLFHYSTIPIRCQSCETRRPRQKSPSWVSTRVSEPISRVGSVEPDFCRARQTNPISERGPTCLAWRGQTLFVAKWAYKSRRSPLSYRPPDGFTTRMSSNQNCIPTKSWYSDTISNRSTAAQLKTPCGLNQALSHEPRS
jgi:hypothetical protein